MREKMAGLLTVALLAACTAQQPSTQVEPTASPVPATPSVPKAGVDPANNVTLLDEPAMKRVRSMTVRLPAFPDAGLKCPAGQFTFVNGRAKAGPELEYIVLHKGLLGISANVDGAPGDEFVVPLGCGHWELVHHVLVLKAGANGSFTALGYVPGIERADRFYAVDGDLMVEAQDSVDASQELRWRFHWNGSAFEAAKENRPFTKDYNPATDDLRNSSFTIPAGQKKDPCGTGGMLSFVDGASGLWEYKEEGIALSAATFAIEAVATGKLDEPEPWRDRADAVVLFTCQAANGKAEQWAFVVSNGLAKPVAGGLVERITAVRIIDGLAVVETESGGGKQTRRFRSNGFVLTEVA